MFNYFIWNGISSLEYGWIKETPFPVGSMMQFEYKSIPNKSTPLVLSKKNREKTTLSFELQLKNRSGYDYIYSWLNNGNNQGELIISDDLKKYYKATCLSATSKYQNYNISSVNVTFDCEPFRYNTNKEPIILTQNQTINVGGNYYSEPKIKIYGNGNGNLSVNGSNLLVYVDNYLTVDTERLLAYKDNIVVLSQTAGPLPTLQIGENTISFSGGISKLEIYKNERWL